jgi:MraZ protein
MFEGIFYHNLDEKGRLTMPARLRDLLGADGAHLMRGFDRNLIVVTSATYELFSMRVKRMSITDPLARSLRRLLFSYAIQIEFDKIGRFLLPQFLRDFAGIKNEVVINGTGDYIEIWSPEAWSEQVELLNDVNSTATSFAAQDLSAE